MKSRGYDDHEQRDAHKTAKEKELMELVTQQLDALVRALVAVGVDRFEAWVAVNQVSAQRAVELSDDTEVL